MLLGDHHCFKVISQATPWLPHIENRFGEEQKWRQGGYSRQLFHSSSQEARVGPRVVVHSFNPSYSGGRNRKIIMA
jgi:hypothetical protein